MHKILRAAFVLPLLSPIYAADPGCPRYPAALRTEQYDLIQLDRAFQQYSSRARKAGSKSAADYSNFIDQRLFGRMATDQVTPAPKTSDTDFLRRAYIDLNGRIPSPEATVSFFESTDANKRAQLIDSLLAAPAYADQFTTFSRTSSR